MSNNIEWKLEENEDSPKMLEVYLEQSWQNAFCYALACEAPDQSWKQPLILMTIIAGSDSTLQSMKAAMDIGSNGIYFGHGDKTLTTYEFQRDFQLNSDKGSYEKFPITINQNRKALAIVHDKLFANEEYVLSFDGNPAEDIANLLGGSKYGLHILNEWKDTVYQELLNRGFIEEIEMYFDKDLFVDGMSLLRIKLSEEEADNLISELVQQKTICFPRSGTGSELETVDSLTDYMLGYSDAMVEKLSKEVQPTHNPMVDETLKHFESFPRTLFPVQSHVATAVSKRLLEQKAVIIQGEMSTGKSSVMTSIAEGYHQLKGKKGYFACLMVPPSLTAKWPDEIREIVPDAEIHVIQKTSQLIEYHVAWEKAGRPKPKKPVFFVISFTTMRGDSRIVPAVEFSYKKTTIQKTEDRIPYRSGYYCSSCGNAHQVIESSNVVINEDGEEEEKHVKRTMLEDEFGTGRRISNNVKPQNAFCSECGDSLWTKKVPTRYNSFKEWAKHEKKLVHAIEQDNPNLYKHIQDTQKEFPKVVGMPRRIAAIEYIRRQMRNFFDISIVDEVHELKGGMTAQGNSLGSLAKVSKKVVAGSGTIFGGKAEDVYYLLFRLFPHEMVASGFKYSEIRRFNEEYGNIEETIYEYKDNGEYSNTNSRGGVRRTEKILPGISSFIYGRYMLKNMVNVRLVDVWPDPVHLENMPTIFVDMDEDLEESYLDMIRSFEHAIDTREDGHKLYLPMTDFGISYIDNPFTFPNATIKVDDAGNRELIWKAIHLDENRLLPKEKKLQEIISSEMSEGRKSIVYVRDTGSSSPGRDVRPRLQKVLEQVGAKVCILDTGTTATNKRSDWLKKKIEKENYDVCIVSQELVKVGLDLLCTPTLIYYQFSWSLFTINQSSRRAWRIGQDKECRIFYVQYKNTFQETMATLIAQKNRASAAINGELSSDGISAMLGEEGDLQSMLIQSVKKGNKVLKGSTEDWVSQTSDRAREILAGIGKKRTPSIQEQVTSWITSQIKVEATKNVLLRKIKVITEDIERGKVSGFTFNNGVFEVDMIEAFGFEFVPDGAILSHLVAQQQQPSATTKTYDAKLFEVEKATSSGRRKKNTPIDGQLAFELF
ncbi:MULTISPECIES: DEAD/DEAH box helicase [Metabacillus]|uniref:DEAD/DEAH box helicase n=1 Tax=Metabacillus TaxID=2675233 RepID=UPI000C80CAA8|nr:MULTISPECIES: DEAD/DEAH box helicase [Metabacillus]MCM3443958.1 DEAD/DEAH box helicase [Metabacillus halosaccharovorans]PMC34990.1 helicase [Bacillus sp. UMB0899]